MGEQDRRLPPIAIKLNLSLPPTADRWEIRVNNRVKLRTGTRDQAETWVRYWRALGRVVVHQAA